MVFFQFALTLFFSLAFEFAFVCLFIEGLFLGSEHIGDELIADGFWVDFALDIALLGQFAHLVVQHLLHLLFAL